ncbi:helix-turn-helix domain-containing protein [Actinomadura hibisca]|uniref:helix-turn-helix domain-containing protein n=1 Tax=Actinomadura hibisca TaxID=68565 RepID=UPI000836FD5A|nr:helix-turn-helix transcriptional regulator [Actinomadura hibisca]
MKHFLAVYLHFLRTEHGYTCAYVGERVGVARQLVSNWESGYRRPAQEHAKALDALYGTGELIQILLHYALSAHEPDWFGAHVELESKSNVIHLYECQVIPGLLQTEAYARTVFTLGGESEDPERAVRARMARQEALTRPDSPRLWVLLEQDVIERLVGGPEVMREQLERLLELSERPKITIRIVPRSLGYHIGLRGAFKVLRVGKESLTYTEAAAGGRLTTDPVEVERMAERFEVISADALTREASRDLLRRIMESLK